MVAEALQINQDIGTDFLAEAIEKEMQNIQVAFKFLDDNSLAMVCTTGPTDNTGTTSKLAPWKTLLLQLFWQDTFLTMKELTQENCLLVSFQVRQRN